MSIVIAGGGLAGGAVACLLAQAGRDVTVIERSTGPTHKICGEFLSHEVQHYLHRLGLDVEALGGHQITHVRLVIGSHTITAALPFRGLGLTRRTLDEAVLARAAASGATVRRGESVTSPDGVTFLATGKHDLRGARRLARDQHRALEACVEVILFEGGYAGLQRVEGEQANLCLLVHRSRLADWDDPLADLCRKVPHLARRLAGGTALLDRPLSIARVPYGFVHVADPADAFYRLGDQACVIPSFSGDGMALALHSSALAARHYLRGCSPRAYHAALAHDVSRPIRRAMWLYRLGRLPIGPAMLRHATHLWPALLRHVATLTRVPTEALL
jgi:flavin-dependent dehydrogenase